MLINLSYSFLFLYVSAYYSLVGSSIVLLVANHIKTNPPITHQKFIFMTFGFWTVFWWLFFGQPLYWMFMVVALNLSLITFGWKIIHLCNNKVVQSRLPKFAVSDWVHVEPTYATFFFTLPIWARCVSIICLLTSNDTDNSRANWGGCDTIVTFRWSKSTFDSGRSRCSFVRSQITERNFAIRFDTVCILIQVQLDFVSWMHWRERRYMSCWKPQHVERIWTHDHMIVNCIY